MIKIRKGSLKDLPEVENLWKECIKEFQEGFIAKHPKVKAHYRMKKTASRTFRKNVESGLKSRKLALFVVERENEMIGYGIACMKEEIPVFKTKIGGIWDLFILKKFRNNRLKSKLKDEAFRWMKKKGIKHVSATLYSDDKSGYSLLRKWGFSDHKIEMRKEI
ncbi:MAG: GNAT family N-acetyltransferase [Candidatus Aenigmatarchaeota archaeon]|nr:MAG: GNAT family N-acetyltransferase [Candidatus Aenigmarchaeota archaeon]